MVEVGQSGHLKLQMSVGSIIKRPENPKSQNCHGKWGKTSDPMLCFSWDFIL